MRTPTEVNPASGTPSHRSCATPALNANPHLTVPFLTIGHELALSSSDAAGVDIKHSKMAASGNGLHTLQANRESWRSADTG